MPVELDCPRCGKRGVPVVRQHKERPDQALPYLGAYCGHCGELIVPSIPDNHPWVA